MRRKVIAGALILVGIILFSVPFLFSQTTQQDHNTTIEHYDNVISDLSDTEKADDIAAAENYNQIISCHMAMVGRLAISPSQRLG